jgi:hypothetical protein
MVHQAHSPTWAHMAAHMAHMAHLLRGLDPLRQAQQLSAPLGSRGHPPLLHRRLARAPRLVQLPGGGGLAPVSAHHPPWADTEHPQRPTPGLGRAWGGGGGTDRAGAHGKGERGVGNGSRRWGRGIN